MDNTDIPSYGTNAMVMGSSSNHNDLFGMFHSFLQRFHGLDRVFGEGFKMPSEDMVGHLDNVFPGLSEKISQAGELLPALGNIFPGLQGMQQ
jgi:hypothetical protein